MKQDNKCDIWSVGIIFYELLYGSTPWPKVTSQINLIEKIKFVPIKFHESIPITEKAKSLIQKMLQKDPAKRISFSELLEDGYFSKPEQIKTVQIQKDQNIAENQNEKLNLVTKQIEFKALENFIDRNMYDKNMDKVYQLLDFSKKDFENFNKKMYNLNSGCLDKILFQQFVQDFLGQGDYSLLFDFILKISLDFNIKKSPQNQQKILIEDIMLLFKSCDKNFEICIEKYLKSQNSNASPSSNINKADPMQQKQNQILLKENSFQQKEISLQTKESSKQSNENQIVIPQQQNQINNLDQFINQTEQIKGLFQSPIAQFKIEPSKSPVIEKFPSITTLKQNESDNKLIDQFQNFDNQIFKQNIQNLKQQDEQIKQPIIQQKQSLLQNIQQNNNQIKNNQFGFEQNLNERKFIDLQKNAEIAIKDNNFNPEVQKQFNLCSDSFFKFKDDFNQNQNINNNIQFNCIQQETKQFDPFDDIPDPLSDFQNLKINHHRRMSEQTNNIQFKVQIQLTSNTTKNATSLAQNQQDFSKLADILSQSQKNILIQQIPQLQPVLDLNKENYQNQINQNTQVKNQTPFFKNISIGQQSTQTHISNESQGQGWDKFSSNESGENKQQFKFLNNSNSNNQFIYNNQQIYNNNNNNQVIQSNNNQQIYNNNYESNQTNNRLVDNINKKQESNIENNIQNNNNNLVNFNNQQYNLLNFSPAENQNKQKSYNPFDSPLSSSADSIGDERVITEKIFLDMSPSKLKENQIEKNDQIPKDQKIIDNKLQNLIQNPLSFLPHSNNINNNQIDDNLNNKQNSISTGISYIFFN